MIEFIGISKVYENDIHALSGVDLKVGRGEFVFLSGPSGAGKSTLLRLLTREELPSSGRVVVEGVDLTSLSRSKIPLLRRRMGIVYQDFKLLYDRTVFENVAFALRVLDVPGAEIRKETELALGHVGLLDKAQMKPHKLSGGEQQCVAVARALVHDPGLVLADEPTGNLDEETSWRIFELLLSAHSRGTTVVVASHNQHVIERLGKRTVHLSRGKIVREESERHG